MARITVEDCLESVPNRFSLVLVAAERTKQLLKGAHPLIDNESDNKEVVTALREIAAHKFQVDDSQVIAEDRWKPLHRQNNPEPIDDELPPEA
ncbi:MAG TPA: DNA-directed RNA polymerase subunit omega [Deltaproteobacteria bacterium]|nr:DNA-directed RNA polymerase subunit omega [Deltaproteobacteria bacterium]